MRRGPETAETPGKAAMAALRLELEAIEIPETLGAFVRARAEALGDAPLARFFQEAAELSYRELDAAADRLVSSLLARGVRKRTHVAVMLPNCAAFPIAWVALGRIGAVIIPVNTAYTGEELQFVLSDSDSQFLIVDAEYLPRVSAMAERPPLIEDQRIFVHGETPSAYTSLDALLEAGTRPFAPPEPVMRHDLLSIQYTSGTTGFPKGCMLTHDYWMLLAEYTARYPGESGEIRNSLIWAPFFYMDAQWQFLMTMQLGATAQVARRMSLSRFFDWLRELRIDYCIFPEPALKAHPPSPADAELDLKYISIYGWRPESREEVHRRFGAVAREGYGMTEVGGATLVPATDTEKAQTATCGLAAPFRELRIVDEKGDDVAEGETGELWIAGRSILLGYYKRPRANAEQFRGRWFRSGDLFRRDAEGYYHIVGRLKEMIKRAGENIAAREVEAALTALPEVEEAAAVPVPDRERGEEVKAYVLLKQGVAAEEVTPERLIAACETRLAAFKIPRYLAYVREFPRTPSGKIQKQRLIDDTADPLTGTWDRRDGLWR